MMHSKEFCKTQDIVSQTTLAETGRPWVKTTFIEDILIHNS